MMNMIARAKCEAAGIKVKTESHFKWTVSRVDRRPDLRLFVKEQVAKATPAPMSKAG